MLLNILLVILYAACAVIAAALLYLLFLGVCVLFVDPNRDYYEPSPFYCKLKDQLASLIILLSNVRVKVEGLEKIPEDELFLMVSNHLSGFDPIAVMASMKQYGFIFVSKPENLRIPIAGRLARRCCFRPIDRENPRNALATVKDCVKLLNMEVGPIVIYPEGTRSRTGELLPFHNSVFKIAQDANVPVVVMACSGTEDIKHNAPWKKTGVTLKILDVLSAEHVHASRTSMIGEEVRALISGSRNDESPEKEETANRN